MLQNEINKRCQQEAHERHRRNEHTTEFRQSIECTERAANNHQRLSNQIAAGIRFIRVICCWLKISAHWQNENALLFACSQISECVVPFFDFRRRKWHDCSKCMSMRGATSMQMNECNAILRLLFPSLLISCDITQCVLYCRRRRRRRQSEWRCFRTACQSHWSLSFLRASVRPNRLRVIWNARKCFGCFLHSILRTIYTHRMRPTDCCWNKQFIGEDGCHTLFSFENVFLFSSMSSSGCTERSG